MQIAPLPERPNISQSVAEALRDMIVDGRLRPGERINEIHLAGTLRVSRTPLREALCRLTAEGALTSIPRSGFYVRPLSRDELQQIYPIRALLDPEALRLAGVPSRQRLARLEALDEELARARDVDEVVALDAEWHLALVAGCPNPVLIGLILQFMRRTRRYEVALLRERPDHPRAVADHERILDALRKLDLDGACAALRRSMQSGLEPLLAWLEQRRAAD